jgi:DNA-binding CsgD family transcriptional regulator
MAGLPLRSRRAVEQLRLIAADASSAELLAERALAALESAVPFDDGALFAVDESSLLFTRLLAYRGHVPEAMHPWLRDTYLVAHEPGSLHFPTLLRRGGGAAAFHEDGDRWLRAVPPPVDARTLTQAWRRWESPAGGAVRYGLAHRHRWVGAVQLARLEPGGGFRPGELELLDRAAPTLARALALRLAPAGPIPGPRPPVGQIVFDDRRRVLSVSASGERCIGLLAPDALEPEVPVALQALVGHLAGSRRDAGTLTATDQDGGRVSLRAESAVRMDGAGTVGRGYAVTLGAAPPSAGQAGMTGAQWTVARAVARGDSDQEIAAALRLSVATVHEHVSALHRLLGTSTRPRLVAALAAGLRSD